MAVRNKWPCSVRPDSSQEGRGTEAEPGHDVPKHLSKLLKCTWHPEGSSWDVQPAVPRKQGVKQHV